MQSRNKAILEEFLRDIRLDCNHFEKLYYMLVSKVGAMPEHDLASRQVLKEWVIDVFIDKAYEIQSKVTAVYEELLNGKNPAYLKVRVESFRTEAVRLASVIYNYPTRITDELNHLKYSTNYVIEAIEITISEMRETLWLSDWTFKSPLKPFHTITSDRKKYVKAREEIDRAKELAEKNPNDVMGHLRTAIDLAIREKFQFKKIKMAKFIEKAKMLDFEIPSYDLVYSYFNEGSKRLHEGKLHTIFEINEVTRTVSNFVDALDLIEISQEQIVDFAKNCDCVEI